MGETKSSLGRLSAIVAAVFAAYAMVMVAACTWWKVAILKNFSILGPEILFAQHS